MAERPTASLDIADGVATFALRRPGSGNAIDLATARLSAELLEHARWDDARALVLRGSGTAFCVGGDLREMASAEDRSAYLDDLASAAHRAIRALARVPVPVVAVVDGAAAGAGIALTLISDLVVAGDGARFLVAYPQVGLTPDCGTSWLLPRTVGLRAAARMAMLGDGIGADDALALGLASHRAPSDELDGLTASVLAAIAATSPEALAGTKRLLRDADALASLDEHLDREQASISAIADTPEAGRRITAFLGR